VQFISNLNTRKLTINQAKTKEDFPMSKLRKYLWMTLGVIGILSVTALVFATAVSENFDTYSSWVPTVNKCTYFSSDYVNGFRIVDAMRDTVASSCSGGRVHSAPYAPRLRNQSLPDSVTTHAPYIEYISTNADSAGKDGGVGTFSFWWKKWSTSTGNRFKVSYNSNGAGWTDFDSVNTGVVADTAWYFKTYDLNLVGDNIKIRITNQVGFPSSSSLAAQLDLDDFYIGDYSGSDTQPPVIASVTQTSTTAVDVLFTENVDATTSQTATNYHVNPSGVNLVASGATRDGTNNALVHLTFGSALPAGSNTLDANGVKDLNNNPTVHALGYFTVDGTPPAITSVSVVAPAALDILFNENVTAATAGNTANYLVIHANVVPATATRDVTNLALVHLTFSLNLPVGSDSINVNGVADESFAHNACANIHGYFNVSSVNVGDVMITELMYDDANSGTDSEWVEIHNCTAGAIDLSNWVLQDDGSHPVVGSSGDGGLVIPVGTTIPANGYLVLSKWNLQQIPSAIICTQYKGTWVLGNSGDNLALYTDSTATGTMIDGSLTVFYPDSSPTNVGYSIERCVECSGWAVTGWHSSTTVFSATGSYRRCTPGAANSSCNDVTPPTLSSVTVVDMNNLDVRFSENVQQIPAETVTNYSLDNGYGNPTTATRQTDNAVVRLYYATALGYANYTLSVSNILDLAANIISPNPSTIGFTIQEPPSLKFTELMPNPNLVGLADSLGEWFEIYNSGTMPLDMSGWIIGDKTGGKDTLEGPVSIASHQYFVFGSNGDLGTNGGVPVNYAYHYRTYQTTWGLQITNITDSIWIRDAANNPVTELKYNPNFSFGNGISAQLSDLGADFRMASNWCRCAQSWVGATLGDKGTPGAASVCDATQGTIQTVCDIKTEDNCGLLYYADMRVKTQGVVTYTNSCTKNLFVEDNGCAVMIYGNAVTNNMTNAARPAQAGDLVIVDGFITNYNGLAEYSISSGAGLDVTLTLAGEGYSVPGPVTVAASAVQWHVNNCNAEQWESRMIRVDNLQFGETGNFVASHNYNMISPSGDSVQFRTQATACEPLVGTAIPQGMVTFRGILSQYKKAACYCDSFQCIVGNLTPFVPLCSTPIELTAYKVGVDSVQLRWQPGLNQGCNCYSIYYCDTQDGTYTLLANVTGVTEYIDDTSPMETLRFYKVTAGGEGCP
jgi:hypothetical protein